VDFQCPIGNVSLNEGDKDGDQYNGKHYINNSFRIATDDGRSSRALGVTPAGDGSYTFKGSARDGIWGKAYEIKATGTVSGWNGNSRVTGMDQTVTVSAGQISCVTLYNQAPAMPGYLHVNMFPPASGKYPNMECIPVVTEIQDAENMPQGSDAAISYSVLTRHPCVVIDATNVVIPAGSDYVEGTAKFQAYNGYNYVKNGLDENGNIAVKLLPVEATLTVRITNKILYVESVATPSGVTAREGGIASISAGSSVGGIDSLEIGHTQAIPVRGPNDTISFEALADGTIYEFDKWTTGSFTDLSPSGIATFEELAGSPNANSATLTATFTILNFVSFTANANGKGTVSPTKKSVKPGTNVSLTCYAKGSQLKRVIYSENGVDTTLEAQGNSGYYDSQTFSIKVDYDTTATAYFEQRPRISDNEMDDAKNNISGGGGGGGGGGNPSQLPLPSLLGDDQLAELTRMLQQQSTLEPGTWDYARDLYEGEIQDRINQINDVIADEETPEEIKKELEEYKSTFPTIGSGSTNSGSTTTATTTTPDGTTITTTGTTIAAEETKPSDPALGAAAAGGLLFLNQDKGLYKPYWTTERPDTPLDKAIEKK